MKKEARLQEIAAWCRWRFPPPHPVRLRFEKLGIQGERGGVGQPRWGKHDLFINTSYPLWANVDDLLHEWAHVRTWRQAHVEEARPHEGHDDEFYLELGRIERAYDDTGFEDAKGMSWERAVGASVEETPAA